MNILIAGGAGFIGSNLAAKHIKHKDTVYVIDNLITGREKNIQSLLSNPDFHFLKEDITQFDFSSLPHFDIVYNLASPASPIQYKKYPIETLMANAEGTRRLLDFFRANNCGVFVLTSTSEVYGDPLVHPQKESYWGNVNPVGIRSCYDESKRYSESLTMAYFRRYQLNVRIARIFNTYGPHMEKDDGRVVSNFIWQAVTGQPLTIYGEGKQTRSFSYVEDTVNGLFKLGTVRNIAGEIFNIGNPLEKNMVQLAQTVLKLTGSKSGLIYRKIEEDDPKRRKPDISKAVSVLGWKPEISLEDGLQKTIKYFRDEFL